MVFACTCLGFATAIVPAHAGFDVNFGAAVSMGDDADLYLEISSRYFDRDRAVVDRWGSRYASPDDLAVALFIGRHSGTSLDAIFDMRRRGMAWWTISVRLGVPANAWFVPTQHAPGPPYGKAYGYWRKHGSNAQAIQLTDADAANLVAVRMLHEYYAVPVEVAMERRAAGGDVRKLMTAEYRERHGNSKFTVPAGGSGKGQGRGGSKKH
jgi:hypothetical protein